MGLADGEGCSLKPIWPCPVKLLELWALVWKSRKGVQSGVAGQALRVLADSRQKTQVF